MQTICIILFLLIISGYIWLRSKHKYWHKRQVETVSLKELYNTKQTEHLAVIFQKIYNKIKFENKDYIGAYRLLKPALIVRDLDLLKAIFITDFDSFADRGFYSNPHDDPLSRNLVRSNGDLWRKMRQKLTPTFTSAKMKMMFVAVVAIGERFVETINQKIESFSAEIEIRDLCARFTTDIIGSVAFGLECNSLKDPQAEFRVKGEKAFYTIHPLMESLASSFPSLFHKLGYKVFTKELIEFYSHVVRTNVEMREKNEIKRNDFLDILIDLKNNKENSKDFHLEIEDVIAQSFAFFIAGFETSSSTMAFALYELASNMEVQEKARENVRDVLAKYHHAFSYECLNEMTYIKQVAQETLRKYPVAPINKRVCRSVYTLAGSKPLIITPGVEIYIPVYAIHHDPDYYVEPEKFQPERFTMSAQKARHPMTYLPFGAGPRICIGERFGMMQIMMGVSMLLQHFKFSVCERTAKQLLFDPNNTRILKVKDGIVLKIEKIERVN